MTPSFRSSRTCDWNSPRPHSDASQRYQTYGPIQSDGGFPWAYALKGGLGLFALGVVAMLLVVAGG